VPSPPPTRVMSSGSASTLGEVVVLDGRSLSPALVRAVAQGRAKITVEREAWDRLAASRAVVERALAAGLPVYGLNTGLGARVGHVLSTEDIERFSLRTVRGRAMAVGVPLEPAAARAVMLVRLNGFLAGGSGARRELAELLLEMLNREITPVIPSIGSIGAGDLCVMAHLALAMIGEGEVISGARRGASGVLFAEAGLQPVELAPKDGLAIINSSAFGAGLAALALQEARLLYGLAQQAAALSLEAFRANLTPLDARASAARAQPGQAEAAEGLLTLLEGSLLREAGQARRLQDPLSLRCIAPVHGALLTTLAQAEAALEPELNGAADNPLVDVASGVLISTGNFHTPLLGIALDSLAMALAHWAGLCQSRCGKLLSSRFSGLPDNLTPYDSGRSGFAPLMKTAEALVAEIQHLALPANTAPRWGADGVEDDLTNTPLSAKKLSEALARARLLLAIELMLGAQALELAAPARVAPAVERIHGAVRALVPPLDDDRPLGAEVELLAQALTTGDRFLRPIEA
jgi:histidine ammonia-lyase